MDGLFRISLSALRPEIALLNGLSALFVGLLVTERLTSINLDAAGGNASLITIGW
jgi:delta 1-pyrroline-5-carboxylate dehydrogenase